MKDRTFVIIEPCQVPQYFWFYRFAGIPLDMMVVTVVSMLLGLRLYTLHHPKPGALAKRG